MIAKTTIAATLDCVGGATGAGAPTEYTSPANAEPDKTHASAIANAKRFIICSPLSWVCKQFCSEDRIEYSQNFLQGAATVTNILPVQARITALTQRGLLK